MSKLLKSKKRKVAPKGTAVEEKKFVLVGTYAARQLEKWPGYYNYPLYGKDKIDVEAVKKVNELWLFSGAKQPRYFAAECLGVKTREELKEYGYKPSGKGHGSGKYLLFKIRKLYAPSRDFAESVTIRTKDFAGQGATQKQLKAYLESPDRKDPLLAKMLPKIVTELPRERLRVCEAAVQLDFLCTMKEPSVCVPYPSPESGKFTFIDLFAGIGGFRLAMQDCGGRCVFSSEWDQSAQETYARNYGDRPFGDITKEETKAAIPEFFDVLCGGFPCQPFSLAGVSARTSLNKKHGFEDKTQGTLFFDIMQIVRKHHPRVLFLENVKNLVNHDEGRTFKVIKESIESEGYSFNYRVIDASPLVPQKRLRCYMVCVRGGGRFTFPKIEGAEKKLISILEKDVPTSYTISDGLWAGHQRRTRNNLARGTGFTAFTADVNKPAHTLVARYYKDGKECLIPQRGKNPRMLTPRECARLQGFPEWFILPTARSKAYKQMGNSVAVPVLKEIAKCICRQVLGNT